jgi:hypothetical protein
MNRVPLHRRLARTVTATAVAGLALAAAVPATAAPRPNLQAAAPDPTLGTATATAGQVDLDLQLLGGLLGSLHLTSPSGLDVPIANLVLGQAVAPTAAGDAANFTNSVLRLRDDLISTLHLPGPEADLLKADVVSGTARVTKDPGGYAQAYATVANLRLFLPLLNLPGADPANGILKIDAVSAQATCSRGQAPTASAKMPTTILLLGHQIPVPLSGDIPLDVGVAKLDVHLAPATTTDSAGASAAVEARISVDAIGLAKVSGAIILASASCTNPTAASAATGRQPGSQSSTSASTDGTGVGRKPAAGATTSIAAAPAADAAKQNSGTGTPLAETGQSPIIWPMAGIAVVAILAGVWLMRLKRKAQMPNDPES